MIKVGIIGSGFGERVTLPCLKAVEGLDVVAFSSRHPQKLEACAKEYGVRHLVPSMDELLKYVDLVCIETPPFLHHEHVEQCIQAGKHVLCEKPMALNPAQAKEMQEWSIQSSQLCAINHQMRFHPNSEKVKAILEVGALGDIRHVHLTYQTATRLNPETPWNWWSDEQSGGGQLNALGSHCVDLLQWWFGAIKEVSGLLHTFTSQRKDGLDEWRDVTSDDFATFHCEFENGIIGSFLTSTVVQDEPGMQIRIVGSKGSLVFDQFEKLMFIDDQKQEDIAVEDLYRSVPVIGENSWRTSLVRLGEHLVECIEQGKEFRGATFQDGLNTQQVLEAVRLSNKENRPVMVNELSREGSLV